MMNNMAIRFFLVLLVIITPACGGGSSNAPSATPTRSFSLGFTPWPYDATVPATDFVYSEILSRGDIIAHHLDSGIPWQEALDNTPYPAAVEAEINTRLANTPASRRVYLAISPFNSGRTAIADYWDTSTNQLLPPAWAARNFSSPEVIQAYINYSKNLINRFNPAYFNLGIEASELIINDLAEYGNFVQFAQQVSSALRSDFPGLKLMVSVALKSPGSAEANLIVNNLPGLVQYVDVVGASIYPFIFFQHTNKSNPANLPANWLSQIKTLANGKPVAIAETGWIAERLQIPTFGVDVDANTADQNAYLTALFQQSESLNAEFIIWFSLVDYDALWNGILNQDPVARIWRDTGLYDENLVARPALGNWQQQLDITLEPNN